MNLTFTILLFVLSTFCFRTTTLAETPVSQLPSGQSTDWPGWRGPSLNGHAAANQSPPTKWGDDRSLVWKTPIPGKGHGSPIVVGDSVYLATSIDAEETRWLLCFDRITGIRKWGTIVHKGQATPPRNKKGTQASSTPACDGERLYMNFLNDDAMFTSALSLKGKILWQTRITDYVVHQGFGSSPLVYENLVIVSADNKSGGAVAGLDRTTGKIVWSRKRPKTPNYPSPVVLETSGTKQLLMTGCELVTSLNPLTGKENWEIPGATTECVTSTVTDGNLIYTSGGYPKNHIAAVRTDGSGKVEWENGVRVYVPSMLVKDGYLYGVTDAGVAMCWKAATGEEIWKGRLGGTFSSSPVLVNDRIYVTNETGETFIFGTSPNAFELISKNTLGNVCFATPAICNGQIFYRGAVERGGDRQEFLCCIAD